MKRIREIQEELENISEAVASVPFVNVFAVPQGFFDEFPSECIRWIDVSPSFGSTESPMIVPDGYFENLASDILGRIQGKKMDLDSTSRKMPFEVPTGYFDSLPDKILSKVKPAKVVSMKKYFSRYAAAAVITGLLGLGIFNGLNNKSADAGENKIIFAEAKKLVESNKVDASFTSLNDADIVSYLKESGQDVDAALVASVIDDPNLPAPEDYLFDENTLNDFLTRENVKQFNN